jgi:hypothetical protein
MTYAAKNQIGRLGLRNADLFNRTMPDIDSDESQLPADGRIIARCRSSWSMPPFHGVNSHQPRRTSSSVLPMTVRLDSSMAVAATRGLSRPLMATGMLIRL